MTSLPTTIKQEARKKFEQEFSWDMRKIPSTSAQLIEDFIDEIIDQTVKRVVEETTKEIRSRYMDNPKKDKETFWYNRGLGKAVSILSSPLPPQSITDTSKQV